MTTPNARVIIPLFLVVFYGLMTTVVVHSDTKKDAAPPYAFEVFLDPGDSTQLVFQLSSFSSEELEFDQSIFDRDHFKILLVPEAGGKKPLLETFSVGHTFGAIMLMPSERVQRKLNLTESYKSYHSELSKGTLLLFWSTRVRPNSSDAFDRFGGYVVLEKKSK